MSREAEYVDTCTTEEELLSGSSPRDHSVGPARKMAGGVVRSSTTERMSRSWSFLGIELICVKSCEQREGGAHAHSVGCVVRVLAKVLLTLISVHSSVRLSTMSVLSDGSILRMLTAWIDLLTQAANVSAASISRGRLHGSMLTVQIR